MFGGDEIGALVLDFGGSTTKIGYAGEDTPRFNIPTFVGSIDDAANPPTENGSSHTNGDVSMADSSATKPTTTKNNFVGNQQLSVRRDFMKLESPFVDGSIEKWDVFEKLCGYALKDCLQLDPTVHPILFSEANFNSKKARETLTEYMFEKFQVPAFFLCKSAVLSAFGNGKSTALVIECGGSTTNVVPVHDGYPIVRSSLKTNFGGDDISKVLLYRLESKGCNVRPSYMFTKKAGKAIPTDVQNTHPSYELFRKLEIVRDIKETYLRVSESMFNEREHANIPNLSYELPDGGFADIGTERFSIPEIMFNPSYYPSTMSGWDGPRYSIQEMVAKSINSCDADIRRELTSNIVLTGGSTLFNGFQTRLNKELSESLTSSQMNRVKVSVATSPERRFGSWLGGSILGSLGSFHQMWISQLEYSEHGKGIVEKKCP